MKKRTKRFLAAFAAVCLLVLAMIWIDQSNQPAVIGDVPAGSLLSTKVYDLPEDTKLVVTNGIVAAGTMEEMIKRSTLVVSGTVSYIHEPVYVESAQGALFIDTDVDIVPEQVFRGEAEEKITIRIPGGYIDGTYYEHPSVPELLLNQKYLFFLYRSSKGLGIYTDGGQYYLRGLSGGVFVPNSDKKEALFANSAAVPAKKAKESENLTETLATDGVFSQETLTTLCDRLNRESPYDETDVAEETMKAYEGNWKGGVITKAGKVDLLTFAESFAHEITEEEAKAPDPKAEAEKARLRAYDQATYGEDTAE